MFNDDLLFAGVGDASVMAWKVPTGELQCKLNGHMEFHAVSALLSVEGKLYSAGYDGVVSKWNVSELKEAISNRPVEDVIEEVDVRVKAQPVVAQSNNIFDDIETNCELLD